jgi:hypothetical protein
MDLRSKLHREYIEAKSRLEALEHFPDLEEFQDIWKQTRLISETANVLAQKFEVRNECDCCVAAPIYALPYIEFQGIRIYTKPCLVSFAKRWRNGILCAGDWEGDHPWMSQELVDNIWDYIESHEDIEEEYELLDPPGVVDDAN